MQNSQEKADLQNIRCAKLTCAPNNRVVVMQNSQEKADLQNIRCARLPCAPNNLVVIMQNSQEKANLQKTKVDAMKIRKGHADRCKLCIGKDWRPQAQ